jgi:hypothetical protein
MEGSGIVKRRPRAPRGRKLDDFQFLGALGDYPLDRCQQVHGDGWSLLTPRVQRLNGNRRQQGSFRLIINHTLVRRTCKMIAYARGVSYLW